MMKNPTEEQIRALHAEFLKIKNYKEKILFYDKRFELIENNYPSFQASLDILFKQEQTDKLIVLLEKERRNAFVPEKRFYFNNECFVFNIAPLNSYPEALNDYILSKFVGSDTAFKKTIDGLKTNAQLHLSSIDQLKSEANEHVSLISDKLASKNETSLRNQFMTVFYHGYLDYTQHIIKKFSKRKKIIELYLYAQGILYGKYLEALNAYNVELTASPADLTSPATLDWEDRIILFKELGILDLLISQYRKSKKEDPEKEAAQVLCLMLGENLQLSDKIMYYIQTGAIPK